MDGRIGGRLGAMLLFIVYLASDGVELVVAEQDLESESAAMVSTVRLHNSAQSEPSAKSVMALPIAGSCGRKGPGSPGNSSSGVR